MVILRPAAELDIHVHCGLLRSQQGGGNPQQERDGPDGAQQEGQLVFAPPAGVVRRTYNSVVAVCAQSYQRVDGHQGTGHTHVVDRLAPELPERPRQGEVVDDLVRHRHQQHQQVREGERSDHRVGRRPHGRVSDHDDDHRYISNDADGDDDHQQADGNVVGDWDLPIE